MSSIFQRQIQNQLGQLKANPVRFLASRQLNIPDGINTPQQMIESITGIQIPNEYINNPNGYLNYLLSSGNVPPQMQQQILNSAKMFNL